MGETMRDRIARAIHEALSQQDVIRYLDGAFHPDLIADAVLDEMREPNGDMLMSGHGSSSSEWEGKTYYPPASRIRDVWQAMIDAANA